MFAPGLFNPAMFSRRSGVVVVVPVVPGPPLGLSATAGDAQASVVFSAPASNGGATITGYTVTSSPAGGTDTNAGTTALPHIITGLTNGTSYTFTVTATNSVGTGTASAASNAVTPQAPVIGGNPWTPVTASHTSWTPV
jgi:hypothetical protein